MTDDDAVKVENLSGRNIRQLVEQMFAEAQEMQRAGGPTGELTYSFDEEAARSLGLFGAGELRLRIHQIGSLK